MGSSKNFIKLFLLLTDSLEDLYTYIKRVQNGNDRNFINLRKKWWFVFDFLRSMKFGYELACGFGWKEEVKKLWRDFMATECPASGSKPTTMVVGRRKGEKKNKHKNRIKFLIFWKSLYFLKGWHKSHWSKCYEWLKFNLHHHHLIDQV